MNSFEQKPNIMPRWLNLLGLLLIFAYALLKISYYDLFKVLEPLLIFTGLYGFFRYGGSLRKTLPVYLLIAAILVQLASWSFSILDYPEWAESSPRLEHLARHFIFFVLAFWISASTRNIFVFWGLALVGLCLAPWAMGDGFKEIAAGLAGVRIDFNIQNAQHTGVLFGTGLLGLVAFYKRFFAQGRLSVFRHILWAFLVLFFLFVTLSSQTRSIFIALLLLFLLVGLPYLCRLFVNNDPGGFRLVLKRVTILGLLMVLIVAAIFFSDGVVQRYKGELVEVQHLFDSDLNALSASSIGIRIQSWRAALEWVSQRPLVGWGGNGGGLVMRHTEWLQAYTHGHFGHLHNCYLEMLVRYGLLGAGLYFVLLFWLIKRSYLAWKHQVLPTDFFIFFILFFIFWLIVNFFESYMFYWTGVYIFNLILAVLVSFIWKDQYGEALS